MFKQYELVFPATKHFCPICDAGYDDYSAAQACIDNHAKPETVEAYYGYNRTLNCPEFILVALSDGRMAKYQLCSTFDNDIEVEP